MELRQRVEEAQAEREADKVSLCVGDWEELIDRLGEPEGVA